MSDTDVLIIGGGPVGLALAVDLGLRGIAVTLVEQGARHSPQPRAKTTNVRSMEHMRRWGVAEAIREAAPLPRDYPTDVIFATRLFGRILATFHNAFFGTQGPPDDRFAERAQWTPQYKVEAALRARAASLPGVMLRFGARLASDLARPHLESEGPVGDAVRAEVGALILAGKAREFYSLGVVLGTHYDNSPLVVTDGTPTVPDHPTHYEASARPGNRAPHLWLADGSSLFDHFAQGFTLLVTAPGAEADIARLASAAAALGLPLTVLVPQDARLPALYGARLALIRPDQHVAWRGDGLALDATALLDRLRGAASATAP